MKKKMLLVLIVGLFFACEIMAQTPGDTLWTRTYGGLGDEEANTVIQTDDDGFLMAGYTTSYGAGDYDGWFVRTNSAGDTLWTRTYGGIYAEVVWDLKKTNDGGYIAAGQETILVGGDFDFQFWLLRLNSEGDTLWTRRYGGDEDDVAHSVCQTSDGGYIIGGFTRSFGVSNDDCYLVRTDSNGDTLWTRTYGGSGDDQIWEVNETEDGEFIFCAITDSYDKMIMVVRTDSSGNVIWMNTYGGDNDNYQGPYSMKQTYDGGFLIAGFAFDSNWLMDGYLIKIDSNGDTLWTNYYGVEGAGDECFYSVQETTDNGLIVGGLSLGDCWLVRTNSIGDTLWTRTYGGDEMDLVLSVCQINNGDYIAAGLTDSYGAGNNHCDIYLLNIAGEGTPLNPPQNLFVTEEGYATWEEPGGGGGTLQVDPLAVPYWTGTTDGATFTDDSEVRAWDTEHGWMMFDVSGIPASATISSIQFNGYVNNTNWPWWAISQVTSDPLTTTAADMYTDIDNGPDYNFYQETSGFAPGWKVDIIGGTANADLEAALDQGWWTIGIRTDDYYVTYGLNFDGWNEANPPFLMVDYETDDGIVAKTRVDLKSKASENRELLGYNVYLDNNFVDYTTDLFYQYAGLMNGQIYLAGVSALYDEGESEIIEFEFTPVLDPPQNLAVACIEDHAHFTWEAPAIDARFNEKNTDTNKENTRDLTGYSVYLDHVEVATNIPDLEYDFYNLINGNYYDAGVKAIYDEGTSELIEINFQYTGVGVENILPLITELNGNYPNPFNPTTTISFSTTESTENTELAIYNLKGQKVKSLINQNMEAGQHSVIWDGKDENNKSVSSGIYFYKMNTGEYTSIKKMILMK